jgi:hypothetical protein
MEKYITIAQLDNEILRLRLTRRQMKNKDYKAEWDKKNREKINEYMRRYREKIKESKK